MSTDAPRSTRTCPSLEPRNVRQTRTIFRRAKPRPFNELNEKRFVGITFQMGSSRFCSAIWNLSFLPRLSDGNGLI